MPLARKDLAERDKTVSLLWTANAIRALTDLESGLKKIGGPSTFANSQIPVLVHRVQDALRTHFNINKATHQRGLVAEVLWRYRLAVTTRKSSSIIFTNDTTSAETAKRTPARSDAGAGLTQGQAGHGH